MLVFFAVKRITEGMGENTENDGWFKDGLELIPFGTRIDAVGRFLAGLVKYHSSDPETGGEAMLERLQGENLSGFGYEHENE